MRVPLQKDAERIIERRSSVQIELPRACMNWNEGQRNAFNAKAKERGWDPYISDGYVYMPIPPSRHYMIAGEDLSVQNKSEEEQILAMRERLAAEGYSEVDSNEFIAQLSVERPPIRRLSGGANREWYIKSENTELHRAFVLELREVVQEIQKMETEGRRESKSFPRRGRR